MGGVQPIKRSFYVPSKLTCLDADAVSDMQQSGNTMPHHPAGLLHAFALTLIDDCIDWLDLQNLLAGIS